MVAHTIEKVGRRAPARGGLDPFGRRVRFMQVPLRVDVTPQEMLRTLRADRAPFALTGTWAGSAALLGSDPLIVHAGCEAPVAALEAGRVTVPPGRVGGGWVGYLGFGVLTAGRGA